MASMDDSIAGRVKRRRDTAAEDPSAVASSVAGIIEEEAKRRMDAYHRAHHAAAAKARSEKRPFVSATCAMRRSETHAQHYERFLSYSVGRSEEKRDWANFVRDAAYTSC